MPYVERLLSNHHDIEFDDTSAKIGYYNFMKLQLHELFSKPIIDNAATIMESHPRYSDADAAVQLVFEPNPSNTYLPAVLSKVCVLNDLYATGILDTFKISIYISTSPEIDTYIKHGNIKAVDNIRIGHGIKSPSGLDRDFYSFATKYCSFHKPEVFPIWDTLVSDLIYRWNKYYAWEKNLTHKKLRDYSIFTKLVTKICSLPEMTKFNPKRLDMGLWIMGKYVFRNRKNVADPWVTEMFEKQIGTVYIGLV